MTYQGGEYSPEDLLNELKERTKNENVRNIDSYKDLVDELIEEKKNYGFFSEDEDLEQIKDDLEQRWPEVEKSLPK
jgi:hypothetical protein